MESCSLNTYEVVDFIRCTSCLKWYHGVCVGVEPGTAEAIWPCPSCRATPQLVRDILMQLKKMDTKLGHLHDNNQEMYQGLSRKTIECNKWQITNIRLSDQVRELQKKLPIIEKKLEE